MKTLTDKVLRNLKPRSERYEISDKAARGLRVRVNPSGRVQFRYTYRELEGRQRVASLGEYPDTTLAQARLKLEELKREHSKRRRMSRDFVA